MRVKGGVTSRKRHKRLLSRVKGYTFARRKLYKVARESYLHSGQYSYNDRRKRYGDMRRLWILRLSAALSNYGVSYSRFISLLSTKNVGLSRHVLSEISLRDPEVFKKIVEYVID